MAFLDYLLGGLSGGAAGVGQHLAQQEAKRLKAAEVAREDARWNQQFALNKRSTDATIANLEADNARAGRAETLGRATTAYNALPADFDINTLPEDLRNAILDNFPTVTKPGTTPRLGSMALSGPGSTGTSVPAPGGPSGLSGEGTFSMPSVPTFGMAKPTTTRVANAREQEITADRTYRETVLKPQLEAAAAQADKDGLPELANFYRQQAQGVEANLGAGAYKSVAQREKEAKDETNEAIRLTNAQEAAKARNRPASEPLVAVTGPDGRPVLVPRSEAQGRTPASATKPPTAAQQRDARFYRRMEASEQTFDTMEKDVSGMSLKDQMQLEYAPNVMQSPVGQKLNQAMRAFTEARLRADSGAAVPQHEYDNDRKMYFPQPGDTPETLAQKKQARRVVIESFRESAGPAVSDVLKSNAGGGPPVGTERTINGVVAVWDGTGWLPKGGE